MVGSFETINFALRPAKSVERKIIVEGIRAVARVHNLAPYRYVGFGSPYFQDFSLIHRALGVQDMLSIEGEPGTEARMEFNRPFACIELRAEMSHTLLPKLTWDVPNIVWLDYDDGLNVAKLEDIDLLITKLPAGSMFLVTVNVNRDGEKARRSLASDIGQPTYQVGSDFNGVDSTWQYARGVYDIIAERIADGIVARNGVRSPSDWIAYEQLYHFRYRDSQRMLTLGGLIYPTSETDRVRGCRFDSVPELRAGKNAFEIVMPRLTNREIRLLDRHLPDTATPDVAAHGIPEAEVEKYVRVYRYFPAFVEADF